MVIECPHCYVRIVPMGGGRCPACGKNTRDQSGADLTKTRMSLRAGEPLPDNCYLCDRATLRTVKWKCVVGDFGSGKLAMLMRLLGGILLPPLRHAAFSPAESFVRRMKLRLPQCPACASKPEAEYVDMDNYVATFLVHRDFRE